ncbi:hypothetical protein ES705_32357 [subsurface metagenome]
MGNIDFRTGDLTGKLGGLVGARWKQTPYARRYVVPANPKTDDQMLVRNAFAFLIAIGRRINSTILRLFTIPKPRDISAFNRFVQINKAMINDGSLLYADVKVAAGSLYFEGGEMATKDLSLTVIAWNAGIQGEALASDLAICLVYNETTDLWGFKTDDIRSAAISEVPMVADPTDIVHAWIFFVQGTKISSESVYMLAETS